MLTQDKFNGVIDELETLRDKNGNHLDMTSIIVSDTSNKYSHYFKEKEAIDIRSIAKPIVCLALGVAIEKGLYFDGMRIGLDTPVWQFLSKYSTVNDPETIKQWEKETLMDFLRITMGHDKGLMFSSDIKGRDEDELVNYVVNYPITREVGKDFKYSNAGTFLISTLITEYLGKNLDRFVDDHIFSPLGISDYSWKKFGKYCAGCTGLKMQNEDLHKIGKLLIDDGRYDGKQLVPRDWIDKMRTPQVASPTHRYVADRAYPKWSYGMNLWICPDGNYYCDGSEGQYLIIVPKKHIVITTLGHQSDTEPVSSCLGAWK
jgi:CubicO group peptidase (beta-lactamase class C family)